MSRQDRAAGESRLSRSPKHGKGEAPESASGRIPAVVIVIAVLVPFLASLPTLDGYRQADPPDRVFLGFRYMAGDHFQYASFVRQAAENGRLFMENRFTTEPQSGRYLLLYLWMMGILSRITGLSVPAAWEAGRIFSGAGFLLASWWLTGLCFGRADTRKRLLAYVLIAFSGGIGWILAPIQDSMPQTPGQPGVKDPFNYQWNWSTFGTMLVPLWVAPAAIFILCLCVLARGSALPAWARWSAGALPAAVWFMHPYTGMAAFAAFAFYLAAPVLSALWSLESIPWKKVRSNAIDLVPFAASLAVVIAYLLWARQDQVFELTSRMGFIWSPAYSVFLYPLAYGVLLPLALFGIRWGGVLGERQRWILGSWLAATAILAANPFFAGVKFQYLVHPALAMFAAHGISELRRRSEKAATLSRGLGAAFFGALLFINAPLTLLKDLPKTEADRDIYFPAAEISAMRFLSDQPPGPVLSSSRAGNRIPWIAGKKVYTGHWFLTLDMNTKDSNVSGFLNAGVPAAQKRSFLNQNGIRYVYFGGIERSMGAVDPSIGLESIYDKDGVSIYRVP